MTKPEFEAMVAKFPYYKNRWGYMSAALAQASDLIGRHGLQTALELGAPVLPIIVGADVMDKKARPELDPSGAVPPRQPAHRPAAGQGWSRSTRTVLAVTSSRSSMVVTS